MNHTTDICTDERDLLVRLIGGDEEAFCELYARYKSRLLYFALKFVKSRDFAEDIFQDTFAVVWQSRRFINPDSSFSAYLYTIVRNRILNRMREMANEDRLKEHILTQAIDYSDNTRQTILGNELKNLVNTALQQLTPRQRQVFELSREAQLSHKEIADALGISVNTVQEHISASLKLIRSYLTKYSGTYADLLLLLICLNL
ncbi:MULTISPECIES: RNA polymerase sigma-70 factor [Bacteroides]|uniref:RNA polymerase sigma-70 factor n=1 Tax=Bacteroides TaxID=816 RepID=UPI0004B82405|nr:RNA polymerase sigma-70 factor [Bacteroides neonati]